MSFIEMIGAEHAQGDLADLYRTIAGARGGVANVMGIHSLNPAAMEAHFELYKTLLFGRSELDRRTREMIGVVVSAANRCEYCVSHHQEPLRKYRIDPALLESLGRGEVPADMLEAPIRALLEFARTQTQTPRADEAAVSELRTLGWSDAAILDATLITGYFNFVNRVVLALGVHLEDGFESTCKADLD